MQNITWDHIPWNSYKISLADGAAPENPGRVIAHDGGALQVVTPVGAMAAEVSGRLRYLAELGSSELPALGDYVAVRPGDPAQIDAVLPRRTTFRRKEAGLRTESQVICANADLAVIVTTAPPEAGSTHDLDDFNLRRVERYLGTLDPEVRPVVVLNKVDLVDDPEAVRSRVAADLPGATVITLSALTGLGVDALSRLIVAGHTAVLAGSSGCGKSTLIARLTGQEIRTRAIRDTDGRGRHTTTTRRMYLLPGGGMIVDTPGMREVQLWADEETGTDALAQAFPEIAVLEGTCRFRDCRHEHEPGCAVKEALERGEVSPERYASYLKLREEAEMTAEKRRRRQQERGKQISRFAREIKKMRKTR